MVRLIDLTRFFMVTTLLVLQIIVWPLLTLFLLLPLYVWRKFVQMLSKIFCKDHGQMLHFMANLFAIEYPQMFQKMSNGALYGSIIVEGHVEVKEICEKFLQLLDKKIVVGSQEICRNPELMQTITSWMGFYFWKWDRDFCVHNHIRMYQGPQKFQNICLDKDMPLIYKEFTSKPFAPQRSPWEIWVWHNVQLKRSNVTVDEEEKGSKKTLIILRCHHALCDGFGLMKTFLGEHVVEQMMTELKQKKQTIDENHFGGKKSLKKLFCQTLTIFWRVPFDLLKSGMMTTDSHEWNLPKSKLTGRLRTYKCELVPIGFVREIKKMHDTSFHTILQAAFAGGMRNFMMERGVKIPPKLSLYLSLPMKGHPSKLRNHATAVMSSLPIGLSDPKKRIEAIDTDLRNLRESTVPKVCFFFARIWSSFPHWAVKLLELPKAPTCVMSNFPGPSQKIRMFDQPVQDMQFGSGIMRRIGICLNCLSYDGHLRLGVTVDEAISPDQKFVEDLGKKIVQELHILRAIEIV